MKLSIVITNVNKNLNKVIENLKYDNCEILVIDKSPHQSWIADICRNYNIYYLCTEDVKVKSYFDRIKDVIRGEWIGLIDGNCIPAEDWTCQALDTIKKYNPYLLGGPIDITINGNYPIYDKVFLKNLAQLKWPMQLVEQLTLSYDKQIISDLPIKMICSSNLVIHKENLDKLNQDKVRIGYIGNGVKMDEDTSLIGNGLYFNKRMRVAYET